ncbi:7432_t:CDS:1, partial [Racocetra persica]
VDVWSPSDNPTQQSPEIFVFSPGSKVGNVNSNLPNNHIINDNDTPSFLLSPPTVISSIPSIDHPPCFPSIDVDNLYEHPNMHTDLTNNYSNMVSFQSLQYGTTTLHMSPATTTGTFDTPHISQITTPFSSPHNGTISPLCGTTPHQSPDVDDVDLGQFTNITSQSDKLLSMIPD